jgi:hypothetical protein
MKKSTLTISDFLALEDELTKGKHCLLTQKLAMTTKYYLNSMLNNIRLETTSCNDIKNELVKKYGEEKDGNITINIKIKNEQGEEIINPNMLKFQDEFSPVLLIEKELEHKDFNIEEFKDVSSEGFYPVFYKLINVPV